MRALSRLLPCLVAAFAVAAAQPARAKAPEPAGPRWEVETPLRPLPEAPLGASADFGSLPFRVTPETVRLGRWLFFDRRLSVDGTVSCASCHRPENAFSEPTPTSTGIRGQVGSRKAPPILNAAWPANPSYFWDGRAGSLVEQAKGPLLNPIEMGNTHTRVVATVRSIPGYRRAFRQAYGDGRIDIERVAEAIAAYEATLLSGDSAFDRWDAGDEQALSPLALRGRDLFFGQARCAACHLGYNFTDGRFHNIGVGWHAPAEGRQAAEGFADPGRSAVTKAAQDLGAFKTPTLRDLARRAPYMHDGSMKTLREVVEYYRRGGEQNPWLAAEMKQVEFSCNDVDALVAFLESLDGKGHEDAAPRSFPE